MKDGIEFNRHLEGDGQTIFEHVCKLGHEGIVAKRKDLAYEGGRSRHWLEIKNPNGAAARRVEVGRPRLASRSLLAAAPLAG